MGAQAVRHHDVVDIIAGTLDAIIEFLQCAIGVVI
jgi:hypothetical protein